MVIEHCSLKNKYILESRLCSVPGRCTLSNSKKGVESGTTRQPIADSERPITQAGVATDRTVTATLKGQLF
jgi:hypothetical protein